MAHTLKQSLTLTDAAKAVLDLHFQDQERPCLRIFLSFLHDSGPRLDLAPDTPTPSDTECQANGWRFLVNSLLLEQAAPLTVDLGPDSLVVRSSLDFSQAGGNCGGSCGNHSH